MFHTFGTTMACTLSLWSYFVAFQLCLHPVTLHAYPDCKLCNVKRVFILFFRVLTWYFQLFQKVIITITSPHSILRRAASQRPHWLQWDTPNLPTKLPIPFDDHHPHLIHPSLDRSHSPPQTASGSNQPFCHSTLSGQTQIDRWDKRQVCNKSRWFSDAITTL